MKKAFKNIQTVIIFVLLIIIFFLRECQGNQSNSSLTEPDTIVKIETKYDTIVNTIETYVPEYVTEVKWKTKTIHDTLILEVHDTIPVDTALVLEDYFKAYAYTDTIKKDSVTLTIKDTITQNKIVSRGIEYTLIYPTTTITKKSDFNKRELYVGLGLGGDKQQISYIGSELMLRNKKKQIYGIGLGINSSFEPILTFKMGWKVSMPKFKKPKITIPIDVDPTIE